MKIEDALSSARDTKVLKVGVDILEEIPWVFREQFAGSTAVVVADVNTFRAAGEKIVRILNDAGLPQLEPFVFVGRVLFGEYGYVKMLVESFSGHDAIPVAVGSGTINDLVKLAAHETSRSYMCVATAASMDGYTAFGASITADGKKQTFSCPAPRACVADIDVIRKAPEGMTASGYSDLFAKITAGADWILADRLGEEPIDPTAWEIVQSGVKETLNDASEIRKGGRGAIGELVNGLMLGGFAMQWHETSRPASGAEHQFSHLWNMEHHTNNGETVSHGFQVAIGMLAVTALYEQILKTPFDKLDVEDCVSRWPSERELLDTAAEMFRDTDFPNIGTEESAAKYLNRDQLREQLLLLKRIWPQLKADLKGQLVTFEEARRLLGIVGAPTEPEHIGVSRKYLKDSFVRAQFIRRRYTVLDLGVRTGMLEQWLDGIFGKGGVWSIDTRPIRKGGFAAAI